MSMILYTSTLTMKVLLRLSTNRQALECKRRQKYKIRQRNNVARMKWAKAALMKIKQKTITIAMPNEATS